MIKKITNKFWIFWLDLKPFSRPWYQYFETPNGLNNYRYVEERGKIRTSLMVNVLDKLEFKKDDVVLDVGSNAGLYGIELSSRVGKIYGIELDKKFYKHAKFLKNIFSEFNDLSNHILINGDINDNFNYVSEATVTILGKVIYHKNLNDNQDNILDTIFHSNLRMIILQGHTTQGDYGEVDFMKDTLNKYGFRIHLESYHDEYPIMVGVR